MSRLLRANFSRLFHSRLFGFCTAAIFAMAVFAVFNQAKYNETIDGMLFSGITVTSICSAVFISVFTGAEYSGGTMRNKLYTGHFRIAVYAANLITCAAAALIMQAVLVAAIVCLGIPVIGGITLTASDILMLSLLNILTVTAYASVYTMLAMLINSRTAGTAAAILLSFALIFGANELYRIVNTPEYYPSFNADDESETGYSAEFVPNPKYLTGTKRKVIETLLNILPSGQAVQIAGGDVPENYSALLTYSLLDIFAAAAAGVLLFRRKDLK